MVTGNSMPFNTTVQSTVAAQHTWTLVGGVWQHNTE